MDGGVERRICADDERAAGERGDGDSRRPAVASDEHFCEFADELHVHSGGRDQHQHRHLSGEPAGRHHRHGIGDGEPKAEGVAGDGANDLQRTVWAGAVAGEPDRT